MQIKLCLLFVFILFGFNGQSCVNTYHTVDAHGNIHELGQTGFRGFNKNFNLPKINRNLPDLLKKIEVEKSPYLLSDYAILLMKAGKTAEALEILQVLSVHLPNEYKIAANLGTAYELNGQLDSALVYIQKGLDINPNSHEGSEWVHVRILETKIAMLNQPNLLDNRSVLQLTAKEIVDTSVRNHIEIQIRERFPFCPGPDPIMASLLIDLGDCYAETFSFEYAKAFYNMAEGYYGADQDLVRAKTQKMLQLRAKNKGVKADDSFHDGMDITISGVRYRDIIDDNNSDEFKIDWTKHNHDPKSLLSLVKLDSIQPFQSIEIAKAENELLETHEESTPENNSTNYKMIFIIGAIIIAGVLFLIFRRKTNSHRK